MNLAALGVFLKYPQRQYFITSQNYLRCRRIFSQWGLLFLGRSSTTELPTHGRLDPSLSQTDPALAPERPGFLLLKLPI
jgi:hypothetical protein